MTDRSPLAPPVPPRGLLRLARVLRVALVTAALSVAVGMHVQAEPGATSDRLDPAAHLDRLMGDHRCSTTGFLDGSLPSAALLRTPRGTLRMVSFARGWAAHEGVLPGTLVAVCLGAHAPAGP